MTAGLAVQLQCAIDNQTLASAIEGLVLSQKRQQQFEVFVRDIHGKKKKKTRTTEGIRRATRRTTAKSRRYDGGL